MMKTRFLAAALVSALACAPSWATAAAAHASPAATVDAAASRAAPSRGSVIRAVSAEQQMVERFRVGDYTGAIEAIDRALRTRPDDPLLLYNRACAQARLGAHDDAARGLLDAVRHGFDAFSHMRRDPDLAPIREHKVYRAIMDARDVADELLAERRMNDWRARIDQDRYERVRNDRHRLDVLHAMDPAAFVELRSEIDRHLAALNRDLFGDPPAQWITVILPGEQRGRSILDRKNAHGVYRHHRREMIALDTGVALRHELVHMLHHRHMDALGQEHPVWIREGLAVLFERAREAHGGGVEFQAGERLNLAKRLLAKDRLLPWAEIMTMTDRAFNRESHRTYAQVDAMMRFIIAESDDDVGAWYRRYVEQHDEDATGAALLEAMFGQSLAQIERRFHDWLAGQSFTVTP